MDFLDVKQLFDLLLSDYESEGGTLNDETKKFYLYWSLKNSDYSLSFLESMDALVRQDRIKISSARLSFEKFFNRIEGLYMDCNTEELGAESVDVSIGTSSLASCVQANKDIACTEYEDDEVYCAATTSSSQVQCTDELEAEDAPAYPVVDLWIETIRDELKRMVEKKVIEFVEDH